MIDAAWSYLLWWSMSFVPSATMMAVAAGFAASRLARILVPSIVVRPRL